jgi:hypothetical protein
MRARCPFLLACALLPWSGPGAGQAIYKSVDAQGNVTYSSTPPVGGAPAQPVNIPGTTKPQNPATTEQLRRQAEQEFALRQKARKEQKEQQARALNEAEDRRDRAKRDLEAAAQPKDQVTRSSERSHGAEGQTAAQTAKEQRALRDAERAVRDAKRGKPPTEAGRVAPSGPKPGAGPAATTAP